MIAILPFNLFLQQGLNQMVRIARVGRLYKLVKLTRLVRILKIIRVKRKMVKGASKDSNQDSFSGIDRLLFFILIFFLLTHIVACLWIMIPQFYKYEED